MINMLEEVGDRQTSGSRDGLNFVPERLLKAYAGFMSVNDYRSLGDRGFHKQCHDCPRWRE